MFRNSHRVAILTAIPLSLAWGCVTRSNGPGNVADGGPSAVGEDAADGPVAVACAAPVNVTPAPADTSAVPAATGPYSWRNVSIVAGGYVTGIVFSPAQRDIVYARTDIGGAYRWNAATHRWLPLNDWIGRYQANWVGVESIAPDPTDANKVYMAAGTYVTSGAGVILRSSDRGQTFQVTTTTIPMGSNNDGRSVGERLAVDPNSPGTIYFGSRTSGLWKSEDAAVSFSSVTTLPGLSTMTAGPATTANGVGVSFVRFDPRNCTPSGKSIVYAGVAVATESVFRSFDGGATWSAVPGQPTGLLPSHAALSSSGKLYVTYGGGTGINGSGPNNVTTGAVYRFDTANGSWTNVTPTAPDATTFGYAGVSVDATNPETLVVSTLDHWNVDDLYRSTDGGATWTAVGLPTADHDVSAAPWVTFHRATPNYTGWMSDVEIDPFDSGRALHVTGQGIWGTDDLTAADTGQPTHWDFRSVGIEETAVLDLASPPSGPPLFSAVGDIGGFTHQDLDASPVDGMSQNPVFSSTDSIDFAEANPTIVARVGRGGNRRTSPHGSYSIDGGTTWQPFAVSLPIGTASAGSIAVSADGATIVWDPPTNGAVLGGPSYTRNLGVTWAPSTGIGAVPAVIADRVDPNKFYAFDSVAGAVYASADGAATFAVAAAGLPPGNGRLRATPGIAGDLWLVTANGGLYHSIDAGATFTRTGGALTAYAFGLGMAPPGQTYPALYLNGIANATPGIFRSDDGGVTWTRINDDQHQFGTATVVIGDPRVYGRVYIGTNGRGIFYGDLAPASPP
jgi:hypothetical protein